MLKISSTVMGLFAIAYPQIYGIGDQVSMSHQNMAFEVCYGDYPNNSLKLADLNGDLNGGNYVITFIAIQNGG